MNMSNLSTHPDGRRIKIRPFTPMHAVLGVALFLTLYPCLATATTFMVSVGDGGFRFNPSSVTIHIGDTVQWTWAASGHSSTSGTPGSPSGLWDSGIRSQGATFTHTFTAAGSFPYYCTPHGACCGMTGAVVVASATPTPSPTPAILSNISTRLRVETGANVSIGGFIISGSQPKKLLVRALGPTLAQPPFNVPGTLADPTLELHHRDAQNRDTIVATNNDWKDTQQAEILATGKPPPMDLEAAIVRTLIPGNYTAILKGNASGTGVGLAEVYDVDTASSSFLTNISTRGSVGTGDNVMIAGLIAGPLNATSEKVLVRALGPTLSSFNVPGVLADPTLELHDKNGALIFSNDNWKSTQQTLIQTSGLAPPNDLESAILISLIPGNYTAIVRGKNATTGVALVEVYRLP